MGWGTTGTNQFTAIEYRTDSGGSLNHFWIGNDLNVVVGNITGAWHHIACTFDGTTRKTYLDGTQVGSDSPTGHNVPLGTVLKLGIAFPTNSPLNGELDEVRIWNIALSSAQISTLFNDEFSDPTTPSTCLVAYYQMSNGSGTSVTDNSGNGNTGTLVGNTAWVASTAVVTSQPAPTCVALPVELTYFNAIRREGEVLLTWRTATELNNEGFEIQRAADNAALEAGRWQVLAFVEGNGSTNEIQNYSYTDEHPQAGLNYYRLKQIDFDGKFEYSDVVSVQCAVGRCPSFRIPPPMTN